MKKKKKIIALTLVFAFALGQLPVFAEIKQPNPSLTPLQERLNMMNDIQDNEAIQQEKTLHEGFDQALLDEINNNPIFNEISEGEVETENLDEINEIQNDAPPLEIEEQELSLLASTSSVVPGGFIVDPVNSVFNVLNNNNDYVSQTSGALTYKKSLISLPGGTNGLDLNLSIRYNSDDAVITQNEFELAGNSDRKINFNSFAVGWSFGFPTIAKNKDKYGYSKRTQLSFPDGSGYRVAHDSMYDNSANDVTLTLENYKLTDMTLVRQGGTHDYILTYNTNGQVITFDGTYGYIKQIKDVFDNEINFQYTELDYFRGSFVDYMFNPSAYNAKIIALTQITQVTNSSNRVITLEYDLMTTAYGKEVKQIKVKMDNIYYARIYLDRVSSLSGTADVVSKITDGDGYDTKYQYSEKVAHIYNNAYEETYSVNGSVFLLEKVYLPTGGNINYEYEKARRVYRYYIPAVYVNNWYEVYKVSSVSDSSGFSRSYEYENDNSGYPSSYLNINPHDDNTYTSYTYTGYIADSNFRYYCVTRQNGATTITTFDNKHLEVSGQTYTDADAQNSYIIGKGKTKWQAMIGNYIYHIGFSNTTSTTSGKLFLYRQSVVNGEIEILPSFDTSISSSAQIRSAGNFIYLFYSTGSGTSKKFIAKSFNTSNNIWEDAGEYTFTDATIAGRVTLNNMYFTDNKFYTYSIVNGYLYHTVYNPALSGNARWSAPDEKTFASNSYSKVYVCQNGANIYYNNRQTIYEYNLTNKTLTSKSFSALDSYSMNGGFTVGTRTFIYLYDRICEFNYAAGTTTPYYYTSVSSYDIQKGADNNAYFIQKIANSNGLRPIYLFNPDASDDKLILISNRLINNTLTNIFAGGTPGAPVFYMVSDGTEKVNLTSTSPNQAMTRTESAYNNYNQLTASTTTRSNGVNVHSETTTQSWAYVAGKSILLNYTDPLGNKTAYEYTNSTYYIPTLITQFADTPNAVVTTNTLSPDKKKIILSSTAYSDRTLQTAYIYTHPTRPGNVTGETVTEIKDGNTTVISSGSRGYDPTGTLLASVTLNDITTNNINFL